MRLLTLEQAAPTIGDAIFKPSLIAPVVIAVIPLALTAAVAAAYVSGRTPLAPVIIFGAFSMLFVLFALYLMRKALSPNSWLLAAGPQRLLIKFRSHLNQRLPADDPQVLECRLAEIRSARITKQRVKKYGGNGKGGTSIQYNWLTFLDIFLAIDLAPLRERLKYEHTAMAESSFLGIRHRSRANHFPVSVHRDGFMRVQWNGVTPRAKKAAALLETIGVTIAPLNKESLDFTVSPTDKRATEDKILQLIERGDTIAAARLLRRADGLSLSEAMQFIKDLTKPEPKQTKHV